MVEDAFAYDLGLALNDGKVRPCIALSEREESDGVLDLAEAWDLDFPPIVPTAKRGRHHEPNGSWPRRHARARRLVSDGALPPKRKNHDRYLGTYWHLANSQ